MELAQVRLGVAILRIVVLCPALLLITSIAPAQRSPLPTEAGLMEITERGRLLMEYDAAAWHSTDAVKALKPEEGKGGHYVARKVEAKWVVVYGRLNETRDKFLITYEATAAEISDQFNVKKYDPPQEDSAFYLSAARAIETALAAFTGEKRPYNTAVLPAKSGQLYVYIYPAQTEADVYLIGGDARYLVSSDGSTIQEKRRLHNAIIEYKDFTKSGKAKEGWTAEMGMHNHILDDVPEDTDVFFAMTRKPLVPERIITWEYTYMVRPDGTIKYEGESAKMFGEKKKK
jgi:hypothetical protein